MFAANTVEIPPVEILNLLLILGAIAFGLPYLRNRRKDGTIADLERAVHARDDVIAGLEKQMAGLEERTKGIERDLKHWNTEAEKWKARYEEQSHYTAEPAVRELRNFMVQVSQERAKESQAVVTAVEALAELVQRDIAIVAGVAEKLGASPTGEM